MRAFFVYDKKQDKDFLVIPDTDVLAVVDRSVTEIFIDVKPDFTSIKGSRLNQLSPEVFGRILATRDDDGDVCIAEPGLWPDRMRFHLG